MQSKNHCTGARGLKQVKVDNWGTFFLQRLLQLYFNEELLDLTIKFHTSNEILKVHRLVVTACTDFFYQLEHEQKNTNEDVIIMPIDMPFECVKSIISFMYTGQLQYWTADRNALYRTAQKMNIPILIKLLDTQFNSNMSENVCPEVLCDTSSTLASEEQESKHKTSLLPVQVVSEKRLSLWKRKLDDQSPIPRCKQSLDTQNFCQEKHSTIENTSGPSRFDLPEVDELTLGVFSSFDDITYNTKPIIKAPEKKDNTMFSNDNSPKVFISFNDDKNSIEIQHQSENNSDDDWTDIQANLNIEDTKNAVQKKVRFNFDEKENFNSSDSIYAVSSRDARITSVDNHAKIIREVLKKYPHLVQRNKNIRLKIMQKESKTNDYTTPTKTKVSYLVLKSDTLMIHNNENSDSPKHDYNTEASDVGPWKCAKCNLNEEYLNYYMYRRHMQDVHYERFDPRICEHCGYKATKRNILMYHMYTKHNISPPKSMSFPKCHVCSYIALSESLLIKHQINHKHQAPTLHIQESSTNSAHCIQCSMNFTNDTGLTCREITCSHGSSLSNKEKGYYCIYCGKHFVKSSNLKVHVECHHRNVQKCQYSSEIAILEPSSESEALNTVVTGITTSLNVGENLQGTQFNESEIKELGAYNTSLNEIKFKDDKIDEIIDEENGGCQYILKNKSTLSNSTKDDIDMRDANETIITYVQDTRRVDTLEKMHTTSSFDNYNYSRNDEIIEEVVEELEAIEDDKTKNVPIDTNAANSQIISRGESDIEHTEYLFQPSNSDTDSTRKMETIQYVEEETEILEYVTCTTP